MTNSEIAEIYQNRVKGFGKEVPKDYYDRALDLAIYFNETIPEGKDRSKAIKRLENAMADAYFARDGVEEEVGDS
jgi:hypothetical protein